MALKAGLVAFVATSLVVSLLLAAFWVGHTNFPGHQHPSGTPEHHHSLFQVSGAPSEPDPVNTAPRPQVLGLTAIPTRISWFCSVRLRGGVLARGPPRRRSPSANATDANESLTHL